MKRFKKLLKRLKTLKRWVKLRSSIPKNWNQVTIEQFIQLNDLPQTSNEVTNLVNKLTVLTGLTAEQIRSMSAQEIQKINKRLSFLSELPKEKDVKSFSFKGKNYKRDKIEFSTVAQVTDLLQMNQDEENVGAKILNAIAVIYYRDGESEYTAQRFKQMKDELLTLPFPVALNSSVFFSRGLRRFFPDVLRDSLKKLTIQQTENLIQGIENESESNDFGRFFNGTTSLSDLLQETS